MAETTTAPKPDTLTPAQKAAETRKKAAAKRSATAKKAAQTRAANAREASKPKPTAARTRTAAAKDAAETTEAIKSPVMRAGEIAEKAVLVQVGAALIARERVGDAVDKLRSTYSTRKKTETQLRRFERRGSNALKSIERDAKKTRARIEKDVRSFAKDATSLDLVTARVESAVQSGRSAATKATSTVQERITALV
jgi:hypothetical protein